jgi:hypothetical protein
VDPLLWKRCELNDIKLFRQCCNINFNFIFRHLLGILDIFSAKSKLITSDHLPCLSKFLRKHLYKTWIRKKFIMVPNGGSMESKPFYQFKITNMAILQKNFSFFLEYQNRPKLIIFFTFRSLVFRYFYKGQI